MIFKITFKDPDTLYDAIGDALDKELNTVELHSDSEKEAVKEIRQQEVRDLCSKWFEWGEYITVEVDTKLETIRVVPVKE